MKKLRLKRLSTLFFCIIMTAFTITACVPAKEQKLEGEFTILSATSGEEDITYEYSQYLVTFFADGTMRVYISRLGVITLRNSKYTFDGSNVTETFGNEKFSYRLEGEQLKTTDDTLGDSVSIVLEKLKKAESEGVDFDGLLFGQDISKTRKFNYCPSVMMDELDDGTKIMHIWYCTNKVSGFIMDHIAYRKGTLRQDGKWIFSDEQIVMAPTENNWDSRHTCDPSVIRGEFGHEGKTYTYMMAYLGCVTEDYQYNETGIALANAPEGPWVKVGNAPLIPWTDIGTEKDFEDINFKWGTGMPSLINIDGKSKVLLFYVSTLQGVGVRAYDFADAANPQEIFSTSLSHSGAKNSVGNRCTVGIPDFAYDENLGRLYAIAVTNEQTPPDVTKTHVNSHCALYYIEGLNDMDAVLGALQRQNYTWKVAGFVGPDQTGWERNHNPAVLTDGYGRIVDSTRIPVVVSTGRNSWPYENIFTYRLHGYTFDIHDE